ncbi:dicarboxylate/amino acid:cation symporter [Streptococcus suis]|uniref:dicarboxylate/amino acid:cation symporter n=1 Tax=Streptococcus suis TaxID=1307 RepID=UPI0003FC09A1|nr:dicarboxylate/amino acid:cation symporter [Streptococcus suis]HEM2769349.1 dicarboxylate/amino acid:cation symporter [Streptococcus suis]HEM6015974.1 dicarboxylate/amino acid:cation symporter [Streptococcus suis]
MKNIWNTYKSSFILLASMVIGGAIGLFWGPDAAILQPVADTFLHLLYCCVVPLIFCSLSAAIARMEDLTKLKKILGVFLAGTFISGIISCLFMLIPSMIFDPAAGSTVSLTETVEDASGSMDILGMFTVGDFPELFSRSNLMALIVFTVIFAFALIQVGEKAHGIVKGLENMTEVIVKIIGIVMKIAPLGLGCYFAILLGTNGSDVIAPLSRAILMYMVVIIIYFIVSQTAYAYIGAGKEGVKRWWATAVKPTLTALGTCSSAATLPVNIEQAKQIGIPDEITNLVVPLGANLHKDGACVIQILKIAFLCSVFNIEFVTPRNILIAIAVSVIVSVVMGGIPGGGYVAEIFIMSAFGFPAVAIPIMVLIGTITDAPATAVNVTGDTGLAMVVTRFVEGKDWLKKS